MQNRLGRLSDEKLDLLVAGSSQKRTLKRKRSVSGPAATAGRRPACRSPHARGAGGMKFRRPMRKSPPAAQSRVRVERRACGVSRGGDRLFRRPLAAVRGPGTVLLRKRGQPHTPLERNPPDRPVIRMVAIQHFLSTMILEPVTLLSGSAIGVLEKTGKALPTPSWPRRRPSTRVSRREVHRVSQSPRQRRNIVASASQGEAHVDGRIRGHDGEVGQMAQSPRMSHEGMEVGGHGRRPPERVSERHPRPAHAAAHFTTRGLKFRRPMRKSPPAALSRVGVEGPGWGMSPRRG